MINACLFLQIVFASALTALGAANGSHTPIVIFGAANTVVAGILSFTKGQGLPNRLQQYQHTLRKVREYIEQRERDFSQLGCKLDLNNEIRIIVEMYETARQNDENNDPSTYNNPVSVCSAKGKSDPEDIEKMAMHQLGNFASTIRGTAAQGEVPSNGHTAAGHTEGNHDDVGSSTTAQRPT